MDILSTTAIIIVVLLTALASGAPVVFCLFGLSILFNFIYLGPQTLYMAYIALYGNINQELFLSIPLFVLMATILESSGIASDLYETMHKWMGGLKGGLAMGTCLICALIDAMSPEQRRARIRELTAKVAVNE